MRAPMKSRGKAKEVVGAGVLIISDEARFITGSVVVFDSGFLARAVNQRLISS